MPNKRRAGFGLLIQVPFQCLNELKNLSSAGRLQLVQRVVYSMKIYWARHFVLSSGVIKEVNSI